MVALRGAWRVPLRSCCSAPRPPREQRGRASGACAARARGLARRGAHPVQRPDLWRPAVPRDRAALARRPELLILDEPAAGLAQPDVQRLPRDHPPRPAARHHHGADRAPHGRGQRACEIVTVLDGGKVIAEARPQRSSATRWSSPRNLGAAGADGRARAPRARDTDPAEGRVGAGMLTVPPPTPDTASPKGAVGTSLEVKPWHDRGPHRRQRRRQEPRRCERFSARCRRRAGRVRLGGAPRRRPRRLQRIARLGLAHAPGRAARCSGR